MTRPIPTVAKYMTVSPHTIGAEQTLSHAHALMNDFNVRHLPVLSGGDLVGVLTERDLALIEQFKDIDPRATRVDEAMSIGIYHVPPDARLDVVVSEMASRKYGSAVVVQDRKVVGILTTVDV